MSTMKLVFTQQFVTFHEEISYLSTVVLSTWSVCRWKKCSERCKRCMLAVVRWSQNFLPRRRPPFQGHRMAKI